MSSQLYPLLLVAVLGTKPGVFLFDPATHPEGGVPAHVPDPAGVPELHDGQSKHDAADDAATLLPNLPAGQRLEHDAAAPNVPRGHGAQTEGAAALRSLA